MAPQVLRVILSRLEKLAKVLDIIRRTKHSMAPLHGLHRLPDVSPEFAPAGQVHALVFPCRRVGNSWEVYPTHWEETGEE